MSFEEIKISAPEAIASVPFRPEVIHQVVTAYLSSARAGTVAQKSRSDVSGGGKKPWRQKGTGRARAGTTRSPIWRGGGVTFAARPQSYEQKVNRKMYRLALKSVIAELMRQERLSFVQDFELPEISTANMAKALQDKREKGRLLIVDESLQENAYLSSRNLKNVLAIDVDEVNPYLLSVIDHAIFTKKAFEALLERIS